MIDRSALHRTIQPGEVAFGDLSNNDVPLEGHVQDAISKRLKALLLELMDRDPFGQWGNFLVEDNSMPEGVRPKYDLIVMAGHSLGAGFAGYIAKHKTVRRVVMMANPADAVNHAGMPDDPSPTPASWLTTPLASQTPSGRYWGLIHTNDLINNRFNKVMASWTALGLSASHRFTASAYCTPVHDEHTAHNSVAHCPVQYATTWQTMLGTP